MNEQEYLRLVGKRIRARRVTRGLSQAQASCAIGAQAQGWWSSIECGRAGNITLRSLRAIAEVLGCTVGELVDIADQGR
jgi:transcriptional regulator with XRE-family HTH domain